MAAAGSRLESWGSPAAAAAPASSPAAEDGLDLDLGDGVLRPGGATNLATPTKPASTAPTTKVSMAEVDDFLKDLDLDLDSLGKK